MYIFIGYNTTQSLFSTSSEQTQRQLSTCLFGSHFIAIPGLKCIVGQDGLTFMNFFKHILCVMANERLPSLGFPSISGWYILANPGSVQVLKESLKHELLTYTSVDNRHMFADVQLRVHQCPQSKLDFLCQQCHLVSLQCMTRQSPNRTAEGLQVGQS